MSKQQGKQLFSRRAFVLASGKVALTSVLVGRLFYLQLWQSDHYKTLSTGNRVRLDFNSPLRGVIRDRKGEVLADNVKDFRLVMVREETPDVDLVLGRISQIVDLEPKTLERLRDAIKKGPRSLPVSVIDNLSWDQVAEFEVRAPEIPGAYVEEGSKRSYVLAEGLAHVIGYVQTPDVEKAKENIAFRLPGSKVGKVGIERYYDNILLGQPGFSEVEVNARRQKIRELNHHPSASGCELNLTIDKGLQSLIVERLSSEKSASAVLISIPSGEVLAMVSVPGFDPNQFVKGVKTDQWNEWLNSPYKPLINKATQAEYAPGSIFKLVVGLAGLEHNVMSPDEQILCSGYMELGNHRFHCHRKHGHGYENLTSAIRDSCDIYFYEIAKRLGIDKISAMAVRMGFGSKTGLELQDERPGLMPTKAWKKKKYNKSWNLGETVISGIGQGYLLATPLQLALFGARLAANKMIVPRLVRGEAGEFEPLGISERSRNLILSGMDMAVNSTSGTAYKAHIDAGGWSMAGKTSTSQVRRVSKQERMQKQVIVDPWHLKDHAMFMGYAPINNPRYALAVVIEHGGWSSQAVVPVVHDLIRVIHAYDMKESV